ncbi:MAG: ATP-binding protein [Balneolaceae bacterium]
MSEVIKNKKGQTKAYWSWKISGDKLVLGNAFTEIFECTPQELPQSFQELSSFFNQTDFDELRNEIQSHIDGDEESELQSITSHYSSEKDSIYNLHWKGEVIAWDENGDASQMVGYAIVGPQFDEQKITWQEEQDQKKSGERKYSYITDYSENKEIHKSNVRLKHQFQAVFDTVPNLIFVKDLEGRYLMANKATSEFFGQEPKEIVGKTDVDFGMTEEQALKFREADKAVIEQNDMLFIPEVRTIRPDGTKVWHQTIKVPFEQSGTNSPAVLSVVTDISRRKKNELELSNSLDIIGQQNKRLMNFAHIVSHNLRNHAGNIKMLLSLYDMEESKEEKDELLEHLRLASDQLNESITDLNEIIDQQYKTSNDKKEINLANNVAKIKEILTTDILAQNVSFVENIPSDLTLEYNPAYLESIILNLLSNAIKYRHPDRKPVIKINAHEKDGHVHFIVSDNGLGIDLEKYGDKLFGMYNTFHENKNSKGIGLFITKNQIESMGGTIDVESEPGRGTTFKIELT